MIPQFLTRLILLTVLQLCGRWMLCAAPAASLPVAGDAITLAPFVVEAEQCGFEKWTKSVSQHYIVYTDLGGPEAEELLAKMELLRAATCQLMGGEPRRAGRTIFVFPSRDSDWSKLEHIGREQWRPGASAVGTPPARLCIVREFSVLRSLLFSDDESIHFFSILGMELAQQHGLPRLLWFDQGLGNLLKRAELNDGTLSIGRKQSGDATLRVHGLMPWLQFFKVRASSPEYYTKEGARTYIPQCALLLRHAFTHPDAQHSRHLEEWLLHLASGHEPTEESFRRIFGQDLAQWAEMMKAFLKQRTQHLVTLQVAKGSVDESSRDVAEARRVCDELFSDPVAKDTTTALLEALRARLGSP